MAVAYSSMFRDGSPCVAMILEWDDVNHAPKEVEFLAYTDSLQVGSGLLAASGVLAALLDRDLSSAEFARAQKLISTGVCERFFLGLAIDDSSIRLSLRLRGSLRSVELTVDEAKRLGLGLIRAAELSLCSVVITGGAFHPETLFQLTERAYRMRLEAVYSDSEASVE